jgi:uncharacterized C2H2 Zn-finger protein
MMKLLFKCGICHKQFNLAKSLSNHVEVTHSQKKLQKLNHSTKEKSNTETKVTVDKAEKKTEKTNQHENCPIDNSNSIQCTLNIIDPDKIDCKEESNDKPFSCNVCAIKFTRHTFMINHRLVHSMKEGIKNDNDFSSNLSKTVPKIKTNLDKGY